ncbi:zinc transporter ZntB [Microbulbifer flavimaris]|uniref:Zinc transporter ZntB n=1 Tax=Microbulbifer flavimaris TaxID=1781068 RepID=A0ABX4HYD3_9GAMM|nr:MULTISPECIES: zinc transporter ZntB [Microbulbifer]KUJ82506.1 magnesium transporter CorA [Microbulbifer sp. ZGT114]PCO04712.1 zinc transporter ZntB [Microbulbifer flavimaris]
MPGQDLAPADTGLIHAYLLDRQGGGRHLDWEEVAHWDPTQGALWLHFDYTSEPVRHWLGKEADVDPLVAEALLTEETRPRTLPVGDGLLIALRGVNLNPQSQPEDMVSVRLWVEEHRIISTRKRRLLSVGDLLGSLEAGRGPQGTAELLVALTDLLVWRMSDTVDRFESDIDELEDRVLETGGGSLRSELAQLRKQTITLRRYLAPQREALSRLLVEKVAWFDEASRIRLREVSDRLQRHIEDIDAVRERAAVTQEELLSRNSEQLNSRMYVLSVVAAIFLPLGFLTGLLGINVGGIPGADNPDAFFWFTGLLLVAVALQVLVFRWRKWL